MSFGVRLRAAGWLAAAACCAPFATAQDAPVAAVPEGRVGVGALESLARNEDELVARVGDVELRRSDAFRILDLAAPARSAEVIRQMVLTTGAQLEATRENIDVPDAELARDIESAIAAQKASFALEVDENLPLEDYLRQRHGLGPEQYRAEVRRMVLAAMLMERAVRLDQVRADHDVVELIVVEDEVLARDIATQLDAGASFAVLARKHSIHPSASAGGELPPVPSGGAIPLLDGRVGLQPGERLGPESIVVKEKPMWRLLRLVERVPANPAPWSELRAEVERGLSERPITPDELALFEAHIIDRYGVTRFTRPP